MRANVNVSRKPRQTYALENFRGVDLSSSPLRVSAQHAASMRNMIHEDGFNHKRPGWRQLFALDGRINGFFPFTEYGESGPCEVLLVHAATRLYRVIRSGDGWAHTLLFEELPDAPMQCFYRDERAYIVGNGAFVVYGSFEGAYVVKDVSEIAYVPTTTIKKTAGENGYGYALDAVNLLTPWRKNTVIPAKSVTDKYTLLDGAPAPDSDVTVKIYFYGEYKLGYAHGITEGYVTFRGKPFEGEYGSNDDTINLPIVENEAKATINGEEVTVQINVDFAVSTDGKLYGGGGFDDRNAEALAEVTFRVAEDQSDKIKKCTVGTLFGTKGQNNRLFLSGNPDEKGYDRWSVEDDFTYFTDGDGMYVGGGESAVTGYARLSDNTLAIFKEELTGVPTIYYRTGAETASTDADGDTVYNAYFPVTAGMVGMGVVAPRAGANLDGDSLFLSQTGVWGVELSENVSSGERYARERSRAIRAALLKKDLSGAVAAVHRGRYYLCVGDTVFVADGRYRVTLEGSPDTGYEWWVWDGVPANCFSRLGNDLAFGTADGRVCVFEKGRFCDSSFLPVAQGDMLGGADGRVSYGDVSVHEGDMLEIDGHGRFTVTDPDEAAQSFALCDEQGERVKAPTGLFTGVLHHEEVVVAEFVSGVMDLGTSTSLKTLLSLGVVLEPGVSGPVEIALKTRDDERVASIAKARMQNEEDFDLSALDFSDVSFTGSFAAGHVRRMNLRDFNFIQLRMRSAERADMAVAGVTLEYKINRTQRGYY